MAKNILSIDEFRELLHSDNRIFITVENAGEGGKECQVPSLLNFTAIDKEWYRRDTVFKHIFGGVVSVEVAMGATSTRCIYIEKFNLKP